MSEQIAPELQADAESIGHAVYRAMRAEMIDASRQREGIDTPLLMEAWRPRRPTRPPARR
ncbi:hypothetical protein ID875_20925 [Streptomyces globisporus]|uniref:Uncharacterized protein n=1 Tax=Streptomyces globisporus TaxID=1908 RepID=A0A927GNW0_STRGL|nr:hypothetical protein [Streptomyces globisporus]